MLAATVSTAGRLRQYVAVEDSTAVLSIRLAPSGLGGGDPQAKHAQTADFPAIPKFVEFPRAFPAQTPP